MAELLVVARVYEHRRREGASCEAAASAAVEAADGRVDPAVRDAIAAAAREGDPVGSAPD